MCARCETPKARVLRAYPGAESVRVECFNPKHDCIRLPFWRILAPNGTGGGYEIGKGRGVQAAWRDAAERLDRT